MKEYTKIFAAIETIFRLRAGNAQPFYGLKCFFSPPFSQRNFLSYPTSAYKPPVQFLCCAFERSKGKEHFFLNALLWEIKRFGQDGILQNNDFFLAIVCTNQWSQTAMLYLVYYLVTLWYPLYSSVCLCHNYFSLVVYGADVFCFIVMGQINGRI